jgi:hypothetical protein
MTTMRFKPLALAGVIVLGIGLTATDAQTITRQGSGVEAMFASQSQAFTNSDPVGITWGPAPGFGPYAANAIIPGLPVPPSPAITPAGGNAFAGGGWTSVFNDNLGTTTYTAAQGTIDDSISALPTVTSDVQLQFQSWRLQQAAAAPGYAYLQFNFGSNYLFTFNPGLAPVVNPAVPLLVSGNTQGLTSYAQFDAVINYDWLPVTINTAGVITQSGPTQSLGALSYAWQVIGPGPFGLALPSTGSLAGVPAGDGILSLTGFAWVAGDPVDIAVTAVPEPGTAVGLGCAAVAGLAWRRRRAAVAAMQPIPPHR